MSRLAISVDMDYWARLLQRELGLPWVAADFLGPEATSASLRGIADQLGRAGLPHASGDAATKGRMDYDRRHWPRSGGVGTVSGMSAGRYQ